MNGVIARLYPGAGFSARYGAFDSWRGLILVVLLAHLGVFEPSQGYLIIICFFVISGYCITGALYAHERKAAPAWLFFWRRWRRIYPPYVLSIALFIATRWLKTAVGRAPPPHFSSAVWVQNLTLTQWLTLFQHPSRGASGNPSLMVDAYWTLNYEEQFYIVMGLLLIGWRLRWIKLGWAMSLLAAAALAWNLTHPKRFNGLFLEQWMPFFLGAAVFWRLTRPIGLRARIGIDLGIGLFTALAGALCLTHLSSQPTAFVIWFWGGAFALAFIGLRRFDARFEGTPAARVLGFLGLTSYSIYLTHQFLMWGSAQVVARVTPGFTPGLVRIGLELLLMIGLGTMFWWACERPFLNPRLGNERSALSMEPAPERA